MCAIYKYIKNGEVVYVGKSANDVPRRVRSHSKEEKFKPFIDSCIFVAECKNPAHMNILETLFINYYKPVLNVADKYGDDLDIAIPEIEWIPYEEFLVRYNKEESIRKTEKAAITTLKMISDNDIIAQSDVDIKKLRDAVSTEIESELEIMSELSKLYADTKIITFDIGFGLHDKRVKALMELRNKIGVRCIAEQEEEFDRIVKDVRSATEYVNRYESGILSRVKRRLKRKQAINLETEKP